MTEEEFVDAWSGASEADRFGNFKMWVEAENQFRGGVHHLEFFLSGTLSADDPVQLSNVSPDGEHLQLAVWDGLFAATVANPTLAVAVGHIILDASVELRSLERERRDQQEYRDWLEDARRHDEELAELWEEILEELEDEGEEEGEEEGDEGSP
jgi:hypothetical protein